MLIERDEALRSLRTAARRATAGQGGIALVSGEAGIGKTSLLREFANALGPECRLLWGGCEALDTPRPLAPLQNLAEAFGPDVAELLGEMAAPPRLFPAILESLQSAGATTVLVFEDVHWADHATLDLAKYLGRRIAALRALLVLSLRSDEIDVAHPLTAVLSDLPAAAVTQIALPPLSAQAVAQLARSAGRTDAAHLHRVTAGNPFFVSELLDSTDAASAQIPESVRDAVWSKLSRLNANERAVLELASVVPGGIEPWLMQAVMGAASAGAVDQCIRRGMLLRDDQGTLTFRHELARQATLERLPATAQQRLHARVAEALVAAGTAHGTVPLSRLVHHAAAAEDRKRVLELAPLAAAQAAQVGAHQQATAYLATALRFVADAPPELAARLHEDWAYEAALSERIDDAVIQARHRAIALWRTLGRGDRVGHNLRWLSRLHWYRGEAELADDYANQAVRELEALPPPPGAELAMTYSMRSQLNMLHGRYDEAVSWGERALGLARQLDNAEIRAHALNNVGTALLFSGDTAGSRHMEESLAIAVSEALHEDAARVYTNYSEYAVVFKDFALAERLLAEGIAFDTRHDLDAWTHYLVGLLAQLRMEQGRLHEAETIARGVLKLERLTLIMRLPALRVLGCVRMRQGQPDGGSLLDRFLEEALATTESQYIVPARFALAEAAWLAEDLPGCAAMLHALAELDAATINLWEQGELAVWRQRAGLPQAGSLPKNLPAPYRAELDGNPLAAAGIWMQLGLPYEAALCLMQVSGAGAGKALARAAQLLDAVNAPAAVALARARAQRLGVLEQLPRARNQPDSATHQHPLGLTSHEVQVLRLVAEGLGNAEIARRLSHTPRTVEHQVSAVLEKLNAVNRLEVLLRLRSEPWLLAAAETEG